MKSSRIISQENVRCMKEKFVDFIIWDYSEILLILLTAQLDVVALNWAVLKEFCIICNSIVNTTLC